MESISGVYGKQKLHLMKESSLKKNTTGSKEELLEMTGENKEKVAKFVLYFLNSQFLLVFSLVYLTFANPL